MPPERITPGVAAGLALGCLAVSTSAVLVRLAAAPALAVAFWRCAAGAAVLAPFAWKARRRGARLSPAQRRLMAWSGVLLAAHFWLFLASLSYTTVASSSVLVTMAPLFVGIGAARFLSEPPGRRVWAGIGVAIAGAAVVGLADLSSADLGARALFGDVLAFAGAALVAGYLLLGRAVRRDVDSATYSTVVYGAAAVVLAVACTVTSTSLLGYSGATWLAIGGMVAGPQLLGHTVFNTLLATVSATVVAIVVLAEPVGATLLAWLVLGELPANGFWLGAPLILAGVWLAATPGRARDLADAAAER